MRWHKSSSRVNDHPHATTNHIKQQPAHHHHHIHNHPYLHQFNPRKTMIGNAPNQIPFSILTNVLPANRIQECCKYVTFDETHGICNMVATIVMITMLLLMLVMMMMMRTLMTNEGMWWWHKSSVRVNSDTHDIN